MSNKLSLVSKYRRNVNNQNLNAFAMSDVSCITCWNARYSQSGWVGIKSKIAMMLALKTKKRTFSHT